MTLKYHSMKVIIRVHDTHFNVTYIALMGLCLLSNKLDVDIDCISIQVDYNRASTAMKGTITYAGHEDVLGRLLHSSEDSSNSYSQGVPIDT